MAPVLFAPIFLLWGVSTCSQRVLVLAAAVVRQRSLKRSVYTSHRCAVYEVQSLLWVLPSRVTKGLKGIPIWLNDTRFSCEHSRDGFKVRWERTAMS